MKCMREELWRLLPALLLQRPLLLPPSVLPDHSVPPCDLCAPLHQAHLIIITGQVYKGTQPRGDITPENTQLLSTPQPHSSPDTHHDRLLLWILLLPELWRLLPALLLPALLLQRPLLLPPSVLPDHSVPPCDLCAPLHQAHLAVEAAVSPAAASPAAAETPAAAAQCPARPQCAAL
ncbi:hypothetical protein STEG23_032163 [Scotinomys teguina]